MLLCMSYQLCHAMVVKLQVSFRTSVGKTARLLLTVTIVTSFVTESVTGFPVVFVRAGASARPGAMLEQARDENVSFLCLKYSHERVVSC